MNNTNLNPNRNPNRNRTYSKSSSSDSSTTRTNSKSDAPFKRREKPSTVYVGNLSYAKSENDIRKMFKKFGMVKFVNVILDNKTKKSKGIAFVQMPNKKHALDAVSQLNSTVVDGRTLKVSIAQEREEFKTSNKNFGSNDDNEEVEFPKKTRRRKADKGLAVLFNHLNK